MNRIILTQEQAEAIRQAHGDIQFCHPNGEVIGYFEPSYFTDEEVAEAERSLREDDPRYTTTEVIEYLNSLEASPRDIHDTSRGDGRGS